MERQRALQVATRANQIVALGEEIAQVGELGGNRRILLAKCGDSDPKGIFEHCLRTVEVTLAQQTDGHLTRIGHGKCVLMYAAHRVNVEHNMGMPQDSYRSFDQLHRAAEGGGRRRC